MLKARKLNRNSMDTATDYHLHQQNHAFTDDLETAARLFITMLRNCTYDEPFDFNSIESEYEDSVSEEPSHRSSADIVGTKRRLSASVSSRSKKKSKKTST